MVRPNNVFGIVAALCACNQAAPSMPPYLLLHLAKTHNVWHQALALLRLYQARIENRPSENKDGILEQVKDAQAQLLVLLNETDTWFGLHRVRMKTAPETLRALTLEQQVCAPASSADWWLLCLGYIYMCVCVCVCYIANAFFLKEMIGAFYLSFFLLLCLLFFLSFFLLLCLLFFIFSFSLLFLSFSFSLSLSLSLCFSFFLILCSLFMQLRVLRFILSLSLNHTFHPTILWLVILEQ